MGPHYVLAEFGVTLAPSTEVRVSDSTAEVRYLVSPMRPDGTVEWDEARLADLLTGDSIMGTCLPRTPGEVSR